jgi:hypothetical protein
MDDWKISLVLIILIILFIIPTKDVRSYSSDDIVKIRTIVNVIFSIIIFFVYLYVLRGQKDKYFVLICLVGPMVLIWIIEFIILDAYDFKKMQSRIKSIPNFMDLTEGQIRNELIKLYDKVYDIKTIKKGLKKIGYYN